MQLTILGTCQGEFVDGRFFSLVIDRSIAIDAGGLTAALSLAEQARIGDVVLSHRHFDHIKDLPVLGFNLMGRGQVRIHCTQDVKETVEATILNEDIWIDFFRSPSIDNPGFAFCPVIPGVSFHIGGYRLQPISMPHSVPTLGYYVEPPQGESLLYTSDCGPDCGKSWSTVAPSLLITEVTYSNSEAAAAERTGHLCPDQLAHELQVFSKSHGYYPRCLIVHVNPYHRDRIVKEVAEVAQRLGAVIDLAVQGQTITL